MEINLSTKNQLKEKLTKIERFINNLLIYVFIQMKNNYDQ